MSTPTLAPDPTTLKAFTTTETFFTPGRYGCPVEDCQWIIDIPAPSVGSRKLDDGSTAITTSGVEPGRVRAYVLEHLGQHPVRDLLVMAPHSRPARVEENGNG